MDSLSNNLTIGTLAVSAGVNVETIRFYQRKGLMSATNRQRGSIRRYGHSDLARIRFTKGAQRIGFTLDEVAELLKLDDGSHCEEARRLAEHKLHDVRGRLADLTRIEATLGQLVACCGSLHGTVKCLLIASLQQTS